MKINYNVKGTERKSLVAAISQELNAPTKYLGMPTAAYEVGGYTIDRNGTVTGEDDRELVDDIFVLHSFKAESEEYDTPLPETEEAPAFESLTMTAEEELGLGRQRSDYPGEDGMQASDVLESKENAIQTDSPKSRRCGILDMIVDELNENAKDGEHWERLHSTPQMECGDGRWRNLDGTYASRTPLDADTNAELEAETMPMETATQGDTDGLVIEMPLTGFTPEKLDNLFKLVSAKATLLKAALGADELPIKQIADTLQFPWFWEEKILTSEETVAYATLVSLLCKTAIKKKRVTAKEKEVEGSPKYAMRCFLLSIGMIGDEYKTARKILLSRLEGNSSWKNGKKANEPAELEDSDAEKIEAIFTEAYTPPENMSALNCPDRTEDEGDNESAAE